MMINKKFLIESIICLILFLLISVFIPSLLFNYDPSAGLDYFIFLGPISYISGGIICGFISKKWYYCLITTSIGLIPTYVLVFLFTKIHLYFWSIIFYLMFLIGYFIVYMINKHNYTKKTYYRMIIIMSCLDAISILTYLILSLVNMNFNTTTSAPWYTSFLFYLLFFLLPVVIFTSFLINSLINFIKFKEK